MFHGSSHIKKKNKIESNVCVLSHSVLYHQKQYSVPSCSDFFKHVVWYGINNGLIRLSVLYKLCLRLAVLFCQSALRNRTSWVMFITMFTVTVKNNLKGQQQAKALVSVERDQDNSVWFASQRKTSVRDKREAVLFLDLFLISAFEPQGIWAQPRHFRNNLQRQNTCPLGQYTHLSWSCSTHTLWDSRLSEMTRRIESWCKVYCVCITSCSPNGQIWSIY